MSSFMNFLSVLGINKISKKAIEKLSDTTGIPSAQLKYYNDFNILPDVEDLMKIENTIGVSRYFIMLNMGIYDEKLREMLKMNSDKLISIFDFEKQKNLKNKYKPVFNTELGSLYKGDCIEIMKTLKANSVDMVFADPPFNLSKFYLSNIDDNLKDHEYLSWCEKWIDECIRLLKPGGTFYLWNLPKWNTYLSDYMNKRLIFRHWISTDIKYTLPIQGRLYPSHYSLLMYTKGDRTNTFKPDRLPMEVCNSCFKEIKDYGGYKNKMNPKGISLTDVWYDIPPVRHRKYKAREEANELSTKLLDRVIELSTNPGDTVFDPFGGSGTTYIVAEIKKRKWIGTEIGPEKSVVDRFNRIKDEEALIGKYRGNYNKLFPSEIKQQRKKRGIWTDDSFLNKDSQMEMFNADNVSLRKKANPKKL